MQKNELDFRPAKGWLYEGLTFEDIDLASARTKPELIELGGRYLYIAQEAYDSRYVESTSKTVGKIIATLNEPNGIPIELSKGIFYDFEQAFDRLFIRNAAQSAKMCRLYVSATTQIKPFSSEITIESQVSGTLIDAADVSVLTTATTQVLAVNADRKRATISNLVANATVIRVGTSNAGAARGIEVPIGGNVELQTTDAIYVYNPSGGTIAIGVSEEE